MKKLNPSLMVAILFVLIVMSMINAAFAQVPRSPSETAAAESRERRVKVALALSSAASCGQCRTDEDAARAEAEKQHRAVVLFVGGCTEQGGMVIEAGGIPVAVPKYDRDQRPPTEQRVIILEPKAGGGFSYTTLPVNAKPEEIRDRVKAVATVPRIVETIYSIPATFCPTCRTR